MRSLSALALCFSVALSACDSTGIDAPRTPPLGDGVVQVDPRQTYLRTANDRAVDAPAVALADLGLAAGETACFRVRGDYFTATGLRASDVDAPLLTAVFSRSSSLRPASFSVRVPSALDAGEDFVTGATFSEGLPTDIPEDFGVDATCVIVPDGAAYVYFSTVDNFFADNRDAEDGGRPLRVEVSQG